MRNGDGDNLKHQDLWLEPTITHGHFHSGEEIILRIYSGYNMKPFPSQDAQGLEAYLVHHHDKHLVPVIEQNDNLEINLGEQNDGLIQSYVQRLTPSAEYYGKIILEIGHHHHHHIKPIGLPLEMVPADDSHARMGAQYELQVLKDGHPYAGAEVRVTYASTNNPDYPHRIISNENGNIKVFMSASGNYLFSVQDGNTVSTLTVVKGN